MVGNNLKETQLQQIMDKTMRFADHNEDVKISFVEVGEVVGDTDVPQKMAVEVRSIMTYALMK